MRAWTLTEYENMRCTQKGKRRFWAGVAMAWLFAPAMAWAAGDAPIFLNLDGVLYDSPTGTNPLLDTNATIRVQVTNPAGTCVLYDERQVVNTSTTDGVFNIYLGSALGDAKRVVGSDPGNTMTQVFQNRGVITGTGAGCGGAYTPAVSDYRYLKIIVTPSATGIPDTLSPTMAIGSVPNAWVADTIQGLPRGSILEIGTTANLTQATVENIFSVANYPILTGLLGGSVPAAGLANATNFVVNADSDGNGSGGIQFNVNGSTKATISNNGSFTVGTSAFFVDGATNRVGIGTVAASFDLSMGGDSAKTLGMERHATANTAGNSFTVSAGGATASATDKSGGDLYLASGVATGTGSSNIYLQTATAGASGSSDRAPSTKITVLGNGNVGIGVAIPSEVLEVNGSVKATSFITSSDRRLKKNIVTAPGWEAVRHLRGVSYRLRANESPELGFIAQEVEEIFPEAVSTSEATGLKGVKYQSLLAPLLEALKETHHRVEDLERSNRAMKEELAALRKVVRESREAGTR